LKSAIAFVRARQWLLDNRAAFEESRCYVEENGLPLADYRNFRVTRFDVYRLSGRDEARFVLDVQADLLEESGTRGWLCRFSRWKWRRDRPCD